MFKWLVGFFGYKIIYVSSWGEHGSRYDSTDRMMGRPIHKDMAVAPPWAKMKFVKCTPQELWLRKPRQK
jgi:hypothetical protein